MILSLRGGVGLSDENGNYRDGLGRFVVGNPGGPGRPPGIGRLRKCIEDAFEGERAEELKEKFVSMLLEGETGAWKIAMDRIWPATQVHELSGTLTLDTEAVESLENRLDRLAASGAETELPRELAPGRASGPH